MNFDTAKEAILGLRAIDNVLDEVFTSWDDYYSAAAGYIKVAFLLASRLYKKYGLDNNDAYLFNSIKLDKDGMNENDALEFASNLSVESFLADEESYRKVGIQCIDCSESNVTLEYLTSVEIDDALKEADVDPYDGFLVAESDAAREVFEEFATAHFPESACVLMLDKLVDIVHMVSSYDACAGTITYLSSKRVGNYMLALQHGLLNNEPADVLSDMNYLVRRIFQPQVIRFSFFTIEGELNSAGEYVSLFMSAYIEDTGEEVMDSSIRCGQELTLVVLDAFLTYFETKYPEILTLTITPDQPKVAAEA